MLGDICVSMRRVGCRLAMRLRTVMAPLALHHVGSRHVNAAVQAGLHGAGRQGRWAWRRVAVVGVFGLTLLQGVQPIAAPQPNGKQNGQ